MAGCRQKKNTKYRSMQRVASASTGPRHEDQKQRLTCLLNKEKFCYRLRCGKKTCVAAHEENDCTGIECFAKC